MEWLREVLFWSAELVGAVFVLHAALLVVVLLPTLLFNPSTLSAVIADLRAIKERDPASEGLLAGLFYPGWWALTLHRLAAHPLYRLKLRTAARLVNFLTRFLTGADIHPGARFGRGIFIDHAHGVVIGETAVVGDNVTILHQVTLGGTGKATGKRHPTVEDGVLLSAGAKVLGDIVVGRNSKVGAGSVVVHRVPPNSTVVGVPGRVVAAGGVRVPAKVLDQTSLPDPLVEKIREVEEELQKLRRESQRLRAVGLLPPREKTTKKEAGEGRDLLGEIIAHKREETARRKELLPTDELREQPSRRGEPRSFRKALRAPGPSLIAEIKKSSPSAGLIRADFDPARLAKLYQEAGASALSVLTDEHYFQGKLEYLAVARNASSLPILRKDFIINTYQVIEAARAGADAVLLIVAALDNPKLRDLRETAEGEGLDALVEVHNEPELERALKSGADIIGINNRNLKTLAVDLTVTERLSASLSVRDREQLLLVGESGISSTEDLRRLLNAGVDAVLIGETFMRADDIAAKVREILGSGDYAI